MLDKEDNEMDSTAFSWQKRSDSLSILLPDVQNTSRQGTPFLFHPSSWISNIQGEAAERNERKNHKDNETASDTVIYRIDTQMYDIDRKRRKGKKASSEDPYSHDDNEEENFVVLKESRSVERKRGGNGKVRETFLSFPPFKSTGRDCIGFARIRKGRQTDRETQEESSHRHIQ